MPESPDPPEGPPEGLTKQPADDPIGAASSDSQRIPVLVCGDRTLRLTQDRTWLVGQGTACDLRIDDPSVAEVHALFHVEGHRVLVEDRSAGWTFVDGVEVDRRLLGNGDRVVLGAVPVQLVVPPPAATGIAAAAAAVERVVLPPAKPSPAAAETSTPPVPVPVPAPAAGGRAAAAKVSAALAIAPQVNPSDLGKGGLSTLGNRPLRHEQSFGDLMADELRRAPWFAVSIALHLLVLLLLIWLIPEQQKGGKKSVNIGLAGVTGPDGPEAFEPADEPIYIEETEPPPLEQPPTDAFESESEDVADEPVWELPGDRVPNDVLTAKIIRKRRSVTDIPGGGGEDSGGFRETVAELRASGLEMVFVFDSTGSMDRALDTTKQRIVRTLDVLQALVPDARVGVVTYRDHGPDEAYLTRQVPLGNDYYRVINFLDSIDAEGGGDEPEAVFDGLSTAVDQPWRPNAKRVVVLVGDAEAHPRSAPAVQKLARRFSRKGISRIHTVVTPRSTLRPPVASAVQSFKAIAAAGGGDAIQLKDETTLLQQILTLAFGKEYQNNVNDVFAAVERERAGARGNARRIAADPNSLVTALRENPVPHGVVAAAVQMPTRAGLLALVDVLTDKKAPTHSQQAAAYIIRHALELPVSPIDTDSGDSHIARSVGRVLARQIRDAF